MSVIVQTARRLRYRKPHLAANTAIVACHSRYTRGLTVEAYRPNTSSLYDITLDGREGQR